MTNRTAPTVTGPLDRFRAWMLFAFCALLLVVLTLLLPILTPLVQVLHSAVMSLCKAPVRRKLRMWAIATRLRPEVTEHPVLLAEMHVLDHGGDVEIRLRAANRNVDEAIQPRMQTTCRIFLSASGEPDLRAAFALPFHAVTLESDFPEQERMNAFMVAILGDVFRDLPEARETALAAFDAEWRDTRDRLRERMEEPVSGGPVPGADALVVVAEPGGPVPALVCATTGHGCGDFVSVVRKPDGDYRYSYGRPRILARTRAEAAALDEISGHAKLSLMGMLSDGAEYHAARLALDKGRDRHARPFPVRRPDAHAEGYLDTFNVDARFGNGDLLEIRFRSAWGRSCHHLTLRDRKRRCLLEISTSRQMPPEITRGGTGDRPFYRPEMVDGLLRRFLDAFLAVDVVAPVGPPGADAAPSPADHPLLAGLDIPDRHQPFVDALLGDPYERTIRVARARADAA